MGCLLRLLLAAIRSSIWTQCRTRQRDKFQQSNPDIRYRPGKLAIVLDALSQCLDYLNPITLGREEEIFISHILAYLMKNALPNNNDLKKKVIDDADKFVTVDGGPFGKILHCKIKDGVTKTYVECEFRGDTMQKLYE
jgi:hypothetical protein